MAPRTWAVFLLQGAIEGAVRPHSVKKLCKNREKMKPQREKIEPSEREKMTLFSRSSCPYPLGGV